jgi:hypothetical protein
MGRLSAVHRHPQPLYNSLRRVRWDALFCLLAFLTYFLLPLSQSPWSNKAFKGSVDVTLTCVTDAESPIQPGQDPADSQICQEDQESQDLILAPLVVGPFCSALFRAVSPSDSQLHIAGSKLSFSPPRAPPLSVWS